MHTPPEGAAPGQDPMGMDSSGTEQLAALLRAALKG